ncbi:MAG: hypothetical protein Q4G39_08860 [Brachymonas sp.]|nr:hypothetical protein [Brachymonas sp.]
MKNLATACLIAAIVGCSGHAPARATEPTRIYQSKSELASEHVIDRPAPVPLMTLARGDAVTVLNDAYGKDYWACHVRTPNGREGWTHCTSLDYKRSNST